MYMTICFLISKLNPMFFNSIIIITITVVTWYCILAFNTKFRLPLLFKILLYRFVFYLFKCNIFFVIYKTIFNRIIIESENRHFLKYLILRYLFKLLFLCIKKYANQTYLI